MLEITGRGVVQVQPDRARLTEERERDCVVAALSPQMVTRLSKPRLHPRSSYVIRIPNANVYRFGDSDVARPVLRAVDWTVREGESWAVVGSGASGKTALLEVSRERIQNSILYILPWLAFLDLFRVPLSMSDAYTRRADPSREHADQPPSTRRTSAIAFPEVSSYQ